MTMLELLVAGALLGTFFVGVYGVVWGTILRRQEIEARAIPFSVGPVVLQRVVDDLRVAEFHALDPAKDSFRASGEREEDVHLDFVAAVESRDRFEVDDEWVRAAVNEVGYVLRRSERRSGLHCLYRREELGVDEDPVEGGKGYKLCDGVRSFRIDWYEEDPGDPDGDDADGKLDWDAKKEGRLPWGCRVTLVLVGAEDEESDLPPPEYVFRTYVAFRNRFDKPDAAPTGQQPGR